MIDYEKYCQLRQMKERGLHDSQIAKELSLNMRTVTKWAYEKKYLPGQGGKRTHLLDPYKDRIIAWLDRHPYTARQIFQKLEVLEFKGSYSIVKRYVKKIRPTPNPAFLTLSFDPGECAQVDWGSYKTVKVDSTRRKLSFFVMVLCHSRMIYVEFTLSQSMEFFLDAHKNAFEYFGGVPSKVMIDNLKTGVLSHPFGQSPIFNPRYLDFSNHYGFTPVACAVRKGNEKGRVENGVGYVKKNFLNGLEIAHFYVLNPAIRIWMDGTANPRVHGETGEKPIELFKKEKPFLQPLNTNPYDVGVSILIGSNSQFRVLVDTNRYSVPYRYASKKLSLVQHPSKLLFYHEGNLIATHERSFDRKKDFEQKDHVQELLDQRKKAKAQKLMGRFLSLTPKAHQYLEKLKEKRFNHRLHIQKIMALCDIYSEEKVVEALEDGLHFEAYSSEYVSNILECRERKSDPPGPLHLTRREDLSDLELPSPSLEIYETDHKKGSHHEEK